MQIPQRRHEKLMVRDTGPIHLTPEKIKELELKLERLQTSIAHLAGEAKRTADYGDRSENAEYKEAKGKLRGTHREILKIIDQLKRAVVIKPSTTGKVQIGSTVVLEIAGKKKEFQIVGPDETDPGKGRISFKSPLGEALVGHKAGDSVLINTASSTAEYLIAEVK